ncbi:hypothetical protein AVDCRST_MAG81-5021 [uncultured Synechococcales cyanobacterium]|uniref:Uncharacterized protein n=1 Tax=uncultured Synechococcales cyanobacterium TaxID=1936017 RepID=A0A6J4VV59_9CYAN|nr:hypothetical protein AVDCRST_MAG81-5021 [uncultured Synechococcales cyanobacterium]
MLKLLMMLADDSSDKLGINSATDPLPRIVQRKRATNPAAKP